MIHFCLAHAAHHLHCWLPRSRRLRLQVTVFLLGASLLGVQLYVLLRPRSSRYCSQPLLNNLVGNIALTCFTMAFAILLTRPGPAPRVLKGLFTAFGAGSFAQGVCTTALTLLARDCEKTTPELYHLSALLSGGSLVSTAFFFGQGLLWLASVRSEA